jgi:hypothetical protein
MIPSCNHSPLLHGLFDGNKLLTHVESGPKIDSVIMAPDEPGYSLSHIIDLGELDEERDEVKERVVPGVVIPGEDGQRAFILEHVGSGRVIDDDGIFEGPSDQREVLHKDVVHEGAVLTEQTIGAV